MKDIECYLYNIGVVNKQQHYYYSK